MRKVKLYGDLGSIFGSEFYFDVNSAAEAIRALSVQLDGFEKYLIDSENNGVGYKVIVKDLEVANEKELGIYSVGDIHIIPIISGANGESRVLIGAALVAAATFMTGGLATAFTNVGVAMALGGAVEILSRNFLSNSEPYEKPENKPSYNFSGPINTESQGHPVPVGYGRLVVGGAVISASLTTENLLAGYIEAESDAFKDIYAINYINNYETDPPPNWYKYDVLSFYVGDSDTPKNWKLRFWYKTKTLQLRTI